MNGLGWRIPRRTVMLLACALGCTAGASRADEPALPAPRFDEAFWRHWSDGKAEVSGYSLRMPRYGEVRDGVAVMIFVTETFSDTARVKADPGKHPKSDELPVLKHMLVKDFPTGIYDYNTLASRWITLLPHQGRPAGSLSKVSYSSQEWCGHVFHQLLFDARGIRESLHSYFDGEADQTRTLPYPSGVSADALALWARGLAAPALAAGESLEVAYLPTLEHARLAHVPLDWQRARLNRDASPTTVTVPAGTFEVERASAATTQETITFFVERAPPRRIVRWESTSGEAGELLGSQRLEYWKLNGLGGERYLEALGLKPRASRMP